MDTASSEFACAWSAETSPRSTVPRGPQASTSGWLLLAYWSIRFRDWLAATDWLQPVTTYLATVFDDRDLSRWADASSSPVLAPRCHPYHASESCGLERAEATWWFLRPIGRWKWIGICQNSTASAFEDPLMPVLGCNAVATLASRACLHCRVQWIPELGRPIPLESCCYMHYMTYSNPIPVHSSGSWGDRQQYYLLC